MLETVIFDDDLEDFVKKNFNFEEECKLKRWLIRIVLLFLFNMDSHIEWKLFFCWYEFNILKKF